MHQEVKTFDLLIQLTLVYSTSSNILAVFNNMKYYFLESISTVLWYLIDYKNMILIVAHPQIVLCMLLHNQISGAYRVGRVNKHAISRPAPILVSASVSGQYQHFLAVLELVKYVTQVPILLLVYYTYY